MQSRALRPPNCIPPWWLVVAFYRSLIRRRPIWLPALGSPCSTPARCRRPGGRRTRPGGCHPCVDRDHPAGRGVHISSPIEGMKSSAWRRRPAASDATVSPPPPCCRAWEVRPRCRRPFQLTALRWTWQNIVRRDKTIISRRCVWADKERSRPLLAARIQWHLSNSAPASMQACVRALSPAEAGRVIDRFLANATMDCRILLPLKTQRVSHKAEEGGTTALRHEWSNDARRKTESLSMLAIAFKILLDVTWRNGRVSSGRPGSLAIISCLNKKNSLYFAAASRVESLSLTSTSSAAAALSRNRWQHVKEQVTDDSVCDHWDVGCSWHLPRLTRNAHLTGPYSLSVISWPRWLSTAVINWVTGPLCRRICRLAEPRRIDTSRVMGRSWCGCRRRTCRRMSTDGFIVTWSWLGLVHRRAAGPVSR